METAIIVPISKLDLLPESTRRQLMEVVGFPFSSASSGKSEEKSPYVEEDGPAELPGNLVRKLTERLGDKTIAALRVIAMSEDGRFRLKDVIDAIPEAATYRDLAGVWAALTRRVRKILSDSDAYLILWAAEGEHDEEGNYIDHEGEVARITHQALRAHFRIE